MRATAGPISRAGSLLTLLWISVPAAAAAAAGADDADSGPLQSYNRGVQLYREGRLDEAAAAFGKATPADDPAIAARARFNLGNTHFSLALKERQSESPNRESVKQRLHDAIQAYRGALRADPSDADARANIELATRLLGELKKQDEQQQQQQKDEQQQDEQQQQDGNQQDGPKQYNSKPSQPEPSEDDSSRDPEPQQQEPQQEDQQAGSEEQDQSETAGGGRSEQAASQQPSDSPEQSTSDGSGRDSQPQPRESTPDGRDDSEQGRESQGESDDGRADQSSRQQRGETAESGGRPSPDPTEPSEVNANDDETTRPGPRGELTAENGSAPATDDASMEVSAETGKMTEEEARKLLQAIRDRDMIRRLRRQAAQRLRRVPVERDW